MKIKVSNVNTPNWKEVTVKSRIPAELEKLSEISRNIWWAWNFEATELFRDLDRNFGNNVARTLCCCWNV